MASIRSAIGDKIRGQIATIELHALDDVQRGLHALRFFHRDDAVLADLFHGLGNQVADGRIVIGRNRADLGNFLLVLGRAAQLFDFFDHVFDGAINTALEIHRIGTGGDVLHAFTEDRLRQTRSQ